MTGNKNKTKKSNNKSNRQKVNPLAISRVPRSRMKMNFDGQVLHGVGYMAPNATLINLATGTYTIDFSNNAGTFGAANQYVQSVGYDLVAMSRYFNEYVYTSLQMEWIPNVAPGVADGGSQCYISYIDNAEAILGNYGAGVATQFSAAKNARNSRFFNAWERFVYNVPLTRRRKTFDTNYTFSALVDTFDRSVQGAVCIGLSSVSAAVTLGQWKVHYTAELHNLDLGIIV